MAEFDDLIHRERSLKLRELPKGATTVLSAGCAGAWYFSWFAENYGSVGKHIGLELYSPEPPDLPNNVQWVPSSVDDMSQVGAGIVDLLFSGQNVEHLEPAVLLGFLRESNRVLRLGGVLAIDSPNRQVT